MKGKMAFVAGAAIGYVLGARAGRQRYEQIKGAATKVWQSPGIQKQVQQAQDYAAKKAGEIPGALIDGAKKAMSSKGGSSTGGSSNGPDKDDDGRSSTTTKSSTARTSTAKKPASKSSTSRASTKQGSTAKRGDSGTK